MGEQRLCKAKVAGSNPAISTENLVRNVIIGAREKFVERYEDIESGKNTAVDQVLLRPGGVRRVDLSLLNGSSNKRIVEE